jgi:hypothetical protein
MVALLAILPYVDSAYDWESAVGLCHVPVTSATPDPSGKLSAVVFEVYCGPLPPANAQSGPERHGRFLESAMSTSWCWMEALI